MTLGCRSTMVVVWPGAGGPEYAPLTPPPQRSKSADLLQSRMFDSGIDEGLSVETKDSGVGVKDEPSTAALVNVWLWSK